MVAQCKIQRSRMAKLTKVVSLSQILRLREFGLHVLASHKRVAQCKVEVRLIRERVFERSQIDFTAGVFVQMRIRLHGEDVRTDLVSLCVKRKFVALLIAAVGLIHHPIEVASVPLDRIDHKVEWFTGTQALNCRFARQPARLFAKGHICFHIAVKQNANSPAVLSKSSHDDIEGMVGNVVR